MPSPSLRSSICTQRQDGLTLIELVVVMAIIGILATVAWGGYGQHTLKARRAEGRAVLLQVLLQQERRFSYHRSYRAFQPDASETEFKWYSGEQPGQSAYHVSARACDGEDLRSCVRIAAAPAGTHRDEQCGVLFADTRGRRGAANPGCW